MATRVLLSVSAILAAESEDVEQSIRAFLTAEGGGLQSYGGAWGDANIAVLSTSGPNCVLLYPEGFIQRDDAGKHLSRDLGKPVFSLHIHYGDLWMFTLFSNGEELDRFSTLPEFWGELSPEEKVKWQGNAEVVASVVPGLSPDAISEYLVPWDVDFEEEANAYPDDHFAVGNCWQMTDFMGKLGAEYPIGDSAATSGQTYKLWTDQFPLSGDADQTTPGKKPWWKFW